MAKLQVLILFFICSVVLGGCAVVRTPLLLSAVANDCPVPQGGKVAKLEVQPFLPRYYINPTLAGATIKVQTPGSAENVASFYREELSKHGWRVKEKNGTATESSNAYFEYERGDITGEHGAYYESLSVEVQATDADQSSVQMELQLGTALDIPGLFLRLKNKGCRETLYMAIHSEDAAAAIVWPCDAIVFCLF